MKKRSTFIYGLVALAGVGLSSPAYAGPIYDNSTIYDINFGNGSQNYVLGAQSYLTGDNGYKWSNTQRWNNFTAEPEVSQTLITNALGSTAQGVKFEYSTANISINSITGTDTPFVADGAQNLYRGYAYADPQDQQFTSTFTGLDKNQEYKVWIYTQSENTVSNNHGNGQTLTVNANGTVFGTTPSVGTTTGWVQGQNWISVLAYSDASGNLNINSQNALGSRAVINGIQVAAVPEPATLALLSVGGLLSAAKARRLRKKTKQEEC